MENEKLERALANPEEVFAKPSEVLAETRLSKDEKISVLMNWQRTLVQLQAASEENMLCEPGKSNVGDPLTEVTKALCELGHTTDPAGNA